jgi:hypothetical protein
MGEDGVGNRRLVEAAQEAGIASKTPSSTSVAADDAAHWCQ